jgi:hypothetical protein
MFSASFTLGNLWSRELFDTRLSVTNIAGVALTFEASNSIGARRVFATVISTCGAFVNIDTEFTIPLIAGLAGPACVRASCVCAIRIGTAMVGQRTFIDVDAYLPISFVAVLTGPAIERAGCVDAKCIGTALGRAQIDIVAR